MDRAAFEAMTRRGVVLLDGATGAWLRTAGMPVGVSTEWWAHEHPEIVEPLQRAYAQAGSDIVYAPTFSANRVGLGLHGLQDRLAVLNADLVRMTRRAVGEEVLVAGDFTTTGKPLEPIGQMTYQELLEIYREQIEAVVGAGADLLVAETMLTVEECACFVEVARSVCDLPVMCTLTMESDGHLLFGGDAVEAVETLQALGADAVGLNCSVGPDQLVAVVSAMAAAAEVPVIAKPNAGLPVMDAQGRAHYSMAPEQFAAAMIELVKAGAGIVGGCCGTGPEYIAALKERLREGAR